MRVVLLLALLLGCLTLQTTALAQLEPFSADLTLPFVLYLSLRQPVRSGTLLSFLIGYLEAIFLGGIIGLRSFSFILLYITVRPAHDKIKIDGFWSLFFLALFGSFGVSLIETILRRVLVNFPLSAGYLGALALSSLTTALVSPFIVWLIQGITGTSTGRIEDRLLLR